MNMKLSPSTKVYDYVIAQIKSGVWKAGDQIFTEKTLGEQLGVSRIAVREALEKCSALGILKKQKGAGSFVAEIDIRSILQNVVPLMTLCPMDLLDVLSFRLHFEPANVVEFMKYCTDESVENLEQTYEAMRSNKGHRAFFEADYRFHAQLAEGTRNPIIISINQMLTDVLWYSQEMTNLEVGPEVGLKYHRDILDAIQARDAQLAELLMTRHIEATIGVVKATREAKET